MGIDHNQGVLGRGRKVKGAGTVAFGLTDYFITGNGVTGGYAHHDTTKVMPLVMVAFFTEKGLNVFLIFFAIEGGFLQADNVSVLGTNVVGNGYIALFVLLEVAKRQGVVRQYFEATFGRGRTEVDGAVIPKGTVTGYQAEQGNEGLLQSQNEAEHQGANH